MQARQRSPRGFYASEYRQQRDGGLGRGRRGGGACGSDIFVEAGRLAAEYLVSQGQLPPNALPPPKWQNHKTPAEGGRQSALARLGSADGRRKLGGFDEFGQKGGRRRGSFSRSNGMDWGREYRRNGSWSDRFRGGAVDVRDGEDDDYESGGFSVRHQDEEDQHQYQQQQHQNSVDDASMKSNSNLNEFAPRSEDGGDLNDKDGDKERVNAELMGVKQSGIGKDVSDVDMEVGVGNDLESVSVGVKEVKDGSGGDDDSERLRNVSDQWSDQENSSSGGVVADLVSLCKSVKVPTRTRSSVTRKNLKAGNNGDRSGTAQDVGDLQGAEEVVPENESVKGSSSGDLLGEKSYDIVYVDVDVAEVEPVHATEDVKELDAVCKAEEVLSLGCQSGQDRGFMQDTNQESGATLPGYGGCSSLAEEHGEKRVAENDDDVREDNKKLREWVPSLVPKTGGGGYFLHSNPIEVKESSGEDEISHIDKVTIASDQGRLMSSGSQFTEGDRPFLQCSEEKPSLPSSFRTCDLNLIEASEVHENHVDHPVLLYPPAVSETKKAVPIDIDLTMSHASVSGKFNTHATNGKEIEVIDLENDDSIQEEKSINSMDRKTETMFPGLEGFSNHAQNAADMHDVQDGYGLMISELLGPDFPNCTSVPGDINSVHNEMSLHGGTGTLAEDDSIYMSLGELSMPDFY
ncbi:hypothetical protein AAZX31_04G108200 [Glycine max]|uniref:Uncharacterized protein n=2 Tax=Glycine subgen. Soja TaxID=1462606 RepID=K7KJG9_SOYBN|nr:uncharacterized protein At4g26450 isoform X2 [Glycine max]XP_028228587.1 uncharacterized protein At4g26450-like isoform X2 [Glycine soja]KAG5034687.1 hypothetical protein JHK87_009597 [Glycine soja]KAH1110912.1 hypothetical protein GYH30_009630 [Glycine max]KAH1253531.1 Uncharacterized protein GmHk_04G010162 [Glycine max]KAH1253532.1 Uncharacterized protein GmHk_04G010162 [Glycine max]KRH62538.1 hypothetical protein GLYMA_04G114300v4 [Glycine max]|eukprot:XP_006578351.1 uncharacterized protein At4g26450 isoform X2 [Glycine max]